MITINTIRELRDTLGPLRRSGKSVGFVPTMGALHEGHASLARASVKDNDITVASIFVNPTQFRPGEDLDKYPRTLAADQAMLEAVGVDFIFAPEKRDIYPFEVDEILFGIRSLNGMLCGTSRPGHFEGVVQVVSKLFNIVQPDRAYFGMKDFQQVVVIKRMVEELFFPIEVIPCPIVREVDGLAMSSRNVYLNAEERKQALFLSRTLSQLKEEAREGQSLAALQARVEANLAKYPLVKLDYFDVRSAIDLTEVKSLSREQEPVALIAAFLGSTRLIDNLPLLEK
ncbi:MAG: pantoate--beta-alanine ligase [Bacteroidia bacterium]|nr:pantoate--beta-alanine ligase [Bacteroidia bacterium]